MIFQVIKNGKVMFWTEHQKCIPEDETIKSIKQAGYKVKYSENANANKSKRTTP